MTPSIRNKDKPKILVIDDEQGIRDLVEATFSPDSERVFSARTAQIGLALFKRERPQLVLLDIQLPDMNGIEVLKRIHEMDSETIVIMITGHAKVRNAVESLRYGAYDYVEKPFMMHLARRGLEKSRLSFEKAQLTKRLEEANRELQRKKLKLEQRVVVTEKRLSRAEAKLEASYEDLARHYEQILNQPVSIWQRIIRCHHKVADAAAFSSLD